MAGHIIAEANEFVKEMFVNDCSGHDYFHTLRVYNMATAIARAEGANVATVQLAAMLHDVDDRKLSPLTYVYKGNALLFMRAHNIGDDTIRKVIRIIEQVSYEGTDSVTPDTIEGRCLQDADRLDAIGAIGIARCFAFGGSHGRDIHDPDVPPRYGMDSEQYRTSESTSINHFYEKLLLLKDMMTTDTGRKLAESRHRYMLGFLEEFKHEWNGTH